MRERVRTYTSGVDANRNQAESELAPAWIGAVTGRVRSLPDGLLPSLRLASDEQSILLRRVRDLHLDPLRDALLGMVDARDSPIELLERVERTFLALLEVRPHRPLSPARQAVQHAAPPC